MCKRRHFARTGPAKHVAARRHVGNRRRFLKTGPAKTRDVAKTRASADTSRSQVYRRQVASRRQMGPTMLSGSVGQRARGSHLSRAHVASESHMASPNAASESGVTCPCGLKLALPPAPIAGRGVKMWRQKLTWRHGPTCRQRRGVMNVSSGAVTARCTSTWRQGHLPRRPPCSSITVES